MCLSAPSYAAPWDVVPLAQESDGTQRRAQAVQMQRGGSSNTLQTIDALNLEITATGLGNISALALGENGTLYAADKRSGRIWTLTDRGGDGKIDLRRPLPFIFDHPTGLAIDGETLYVADKKAVWVSEAGQHPRLLASLENANSLGEPHILLTSPDSNRLTLGLTSRDNNSRILEINKGTGQATLKVDGLKGTLTSLAKRKGSEVWAAAGGYIGPVGGNATRLAPNQSVAAIALPGQYEIPDDWPQHLKGKIIASHLGPKAMQLIAIPTEFGQISGEARIIIDGFLASSGRSAWGAPGPILIDKRGLFFADSQNGTLWRVSPKPQAQPKITIIDTADLPPRPKAQPELAARKKTIGIESSIKGTQINPKSDIVTTSSIIYGSKLIKDYDEAKAAEEAAKEE